MKILFFIICALFLLQSCSLKDKAGRLPASDPLIPCSKLLENLSNDFEYRVQTFKNKEIGIYHVNKIFPKDKIMLKDVWDDYDGKHEIVIGVSGGHAYLIADNFRVDGKPISSIVAKNSSAANNSAGFLFRLKDVNEEQMQKIRSYLDNKQVHFTTSCIGYVCQVLQKAGIQITGHPLLPSRKIVGMFSRGFEDKNGIPIKYEIYELGNKHLDPQQNVNNFVMLEIGHGVMLSSIPLEISILLSPLLH